MNSVKISFHEKKISRNAVITLVIGGGCLLGYAVLLVAAAVTGGHLPFAGGVIGTLLGILALFGALWGVLSYDDVRTTQQFKISGIILNIIAVFLAITFIMA